MIVSLIHCTINCSDADVNSAMMQGGLNSVYSVIYVVWINAKISALLKRMDVLDKELTKMKEIPKEDSLIEMHKRYHDNGI